MGNSVGGDASNDIEIAAARSLKIRLAKLVRDRRRGNTRQAAETLQIPPCRQPRKKFMLMALSLRVAGNIRDQIRRRLRL